MPISLCTAQRNSSRFGPSRLAYGTGRVAKDQWERENGNCIYFKDVSFPVAIDSCEVVELFMMIGSLPKSPLVFIRDSRWVFPPLTSKISSVNPPLLIVFHNLAGYDRNSGKYLCKAIKSHSASLIRNKNNFVL